MSTSTGKLQKYGDASWLDKLVLILTLLFYMPPVLLWTLFTHPHPPHKTRKRILIDAASYFCSANLSTPAFQWLTGDTPGAYAKWVRKCGLPEQVDELGEGARLLWVGRRRSGKVILYFHGGAFHYPMTAPGAEFWGQTLIELKQRGVDAGLAILQYSLYPETSFPTPLSQVVLALNHLLASGVRPSDIQITGDSAGGNLALQLLSHALHPLPDVPRIKLDEPLRGMYLMSPWVTLDNPSAGARDDGTGVVSARTAARWGAAVLAGVPPVHLPYLNPANGPDTWFAGSSNIVRRVLVTAGGAELSCGRIVAFADRLEREHGEVRMVVQRGGEHVEPYFELFEKGGEGIRRDSEVFLGVWEWLVEGFGGA